MIPLFDAHLDLAWNAASFNRDLTLSVAELRQREAPMTDLRSRGWCTTTLPELHRAGVAVCACHGFRSRPVVGPLAPQAAASDAARRPVAISPE